MSRRRDGTSGAVCRPDTRLRCRRFRWLSSGNIALISRGACSFAIKATNAFNAGASGVIIYNNTAGVLNGTLGNTFSLNIGVTSVTQAVGQQLAATRGW